MNPQLTTGQQVRIHIALDPARYPIGTIATVQTECSLTGAVHLTLPDGEPVTLHRPMVHAI